ncbi:hypothetical protein [Aquisphaera insulae]|uniref:hypothetical protein n=1 Tax=Aquisphaera insulae TaxID=2712864 RepID=UPI0013EDAA7F|nr:hypothetical protein [Aquisphaera insulae]
MILRPATVLAALSVLASAAWADERAARPAIAIHPENPHYFLFRGKPLVLIAATEHYGSVVNRPFDFDRYLRDAARLGQTVTRTFLLFREQQSAQNPYSPIKPESPDFVTPWHRTGPGKAIDGEPRYDLDRWNPEYFDRLHRFLSRASELGIVVELTLLSNTYGDQVWSLNPLRAPNNLQGVGQCHFADYNSLKDRDLVSRQLAYVRKVVQETAGFDNVYYEICNEPGGGMPGHATPADVDAWEAEVNRVVREELKTLGRPHLVFGSQAFSYHPKFTQPLDGSFADPSLDAVNVHPLPDTVLGGRTFMMGNFMSKELALSELRDFGLMANRVAAKPFVHDEDNAASCYRNEIGWTIHRKRAWVAVMTGGHYDYIDFSINVGNETGSAESRAGIRTWMHHLSRFIHDFDFIHARPAPGWIVEKPAPLVVASLAIPGKDYVAYLADAREVTDAAAGSPVSGTVAFTLPAGKYGLSLYSPSGGLSSPAIPINGGPRATIDLPPFHHDVVIRVTRVP